MGDDVKGELCLIFSGKILKDEETLESHGKQNLFCRKKTPMVLSLTTY